MQDMSTTFQTALSSYGREYAISSYEKELKSNPDNWAAWNNIGVDKSKYGKQKNNISLVQKGKNDIEKAKRLANRDNIEYPIADGNIIWAKEVLNSLSI